MTRLDSPHSLSDYFADRAAAIATMHGKERAIAPPIEAALGLRAIVPPDFDTDAFGTFTRDVPRLADQRETARRKAYAAMELLGATVAIASEGSFGPHPALPLVPCDRELVVLCDREHGLEVWGEVLTVETNFASQWVGDVAAAIAFAQRVGFPDHGLVVLPAAASAKQAIHKGITTEAALIAAVEALLSRSPTVRLETDMRAMHNPTRMRAIAQATTDLIRKLKQQCPQCGLPGFDVASVRRGLPCGLCGLPTQAPRAHIYRCQRCHHEQELSLTDDNPTADPATCPVCNP